jgi:hypothetical protein
MADISGLVVVSDHLTLSTATDSLRSRREVLSFVQESNCRVALVDLAEMPSPDGEPFDGLDAMAVFKEYLPRVRLVALTAPGMLSFVHYITEAHDRFDAAGAVSYRTATSAAFDGYLRELKVGRRVWDPVIACSARNRVPLHTTLQRSRSLRRLILGRMLGLGWADMDRRWGGTHRRLWPEVRSLLEASDPFVRPTSTCADFATWVGVTRPYLTSFFRRFRDLRGADAAEGQAVREVLAVTSGRLVAVGGE